MIDEKRTAAEYVKCSLDTMNRLACNLAAQIDVTRIVFVTIANPYQHENDTYLWLYLETSDSPMTSVRIKGKPDEIQGIIDAERALREANDYRPLEWTSPAIPPTQ